MMMNNSKSYLDIDRLLAQIRGEGIEPFQADFFSYLKKKEIKFLISDLNYLLLRYGRGFNGWVPPDWLSHFIILFLQSKKIHSILDPSGEYGIIAASLQDGLNIEKYDVISNNSKISDLYSVISTEIPNLFKGDIHTFHNENRPLYDAIVTFPPIDKKKEKISYLITDGNREIIDYPSNHLLLQVKDLLNPNGLFLLLAPPRFFFPSSLEMSNNVINYLNEFGLYITASFRVSPRAFCNLSIPMELVVVEKKVTHKMFVAEIPQEEEAQIALLQRFMLGKEGTVATQGRIVDFKTFHGLPNLQEKEYYADITKKINQKPIPLKEIIIKALNQKRTPDYIEDFEENLDAVYLPIFGNREAITSLNDVSKTKMQYIQLIVNRKKVIPEYFAFYLNSQLGQHLRNIHSIKSIGLSRIDRRQLLNSDEKVYIDPIPEQEKTVTALQKVRLIKTELQEIESALLNRSKKIDDILTDLEINKHEKLFSEWVETLPFPLASILCAYNTEDETDKEKFERLLFFFEALSVFYATIHVSACRPVPEIWDEAKKTISSTLLKQNLSLSRASFGVWKIINEVLSSKIRKGLKNPENIAYYQDIYRIKNPVILENLCSSKIIQLILASNTIRNRGKGHGGSITPREAMERHQTLLSYLNDYRNTVGMLFQEYHLVETGDSKILPGPIYQTKIRKVVGSNPRMVKGTINLTEPVYSDQLCFFDPTNDRALMLDKFFVMRGAIQSACYFYNRIEQSHPYYVSYHIVDESEIEETEISPAIKELISELQ
ncbi:hypothetical protein DSECCO2_21830 [anaerobic digester metagenome]